MLASGFSPLRSVGSSIHSPDSMRAVSLGQQPLAAIHRAPGATPIWLPAPSSPTIVPIVCVPWPLPSHGASPHSAGGVEPVVVVVERAVAVVAAVLVDERRVVELHTGVDVGDRDALAGDAELGPHVVGVDVGDAPLDDVRLMLAVVRSYLRDLVLDRAVEPLHLRTGGHAQRQRGIATLDVDGVRDPERLVARPRRVERGAGASLAGVGSGAKRCRHCRAPLVPIADRRGGRQIGAGIEADPERRLTLRFELERQFGTDLVRWLVLGRARRCTTCDDGGERKAE